MVPWTEEEDQKLRDLYFSHTRKEIAEALGRTSASVRARCYRLGLNQKHPAVTDTEREIIRNFYEKRKDHHLGDFNLDQLAEQLGRTKPFVCRVAGQMGLTKQGRSLSEDRKRAIGEGLKSYIKENGHPKGMLGKTHSDEFKTWQGRRVKKRWQTLTPLDRAIMIAKRNQTMIKKYGSGRPMSRHSNPYSRTKSGKREDLDGLFVRSAWEANYARYLNFLIEQGEIASWEYEPKTFVFEGIKRGTISYTPDFKVVYPDGSYEWHEVKGWMDAKSKTRLKRMAKYYPDEKVVLIDSGVYRSIAKWKSLIEHWED